MCFDGVIRRGSERESPTNEKKEDVIELVNYLQELFKNVGLNGKAGQDIDLPQICVVGPQSSGKSSLLKALLDGRDFLPRGTGIVTRCPIILMLRQCNVPREYFEFEGISKRIYSTEEVRRNIESETMRLAGSAKEISDIPIILKFYSRNVLNLTIVDLPGLTKVSMAGQPDNISQVIRDSVLSYISSKNCIILAVSAANSDIANSDGLQIAKEVDPEGHRTVGVLTKLDIMDEGTDVLDLLEGRTYKLKYGFFGVINGSQKDIDDNVDVETIREKERKFFHENPVYKDVAQMQGTEQLNRRLHQILEEHIRNSLPDVMVQIKDKLSSSKKELQVMGWTDGGADHEPRKIVLDLIKEFDKQYGHFMEGKHSQVDMTAGIIGSALLKEVWEPQFRKNIESLDLRDPLTAEQIHHVIKNAEGVHAELFLSTQAFEILCKKLINLLENPVQECVNSTFEVMQSCIHTVLSRLFEDRPYDTLREEMYRVAIQLLNDCKDKATEYVRDFLDAEKSLIDSKTFEFELAKAEAHRIRYQDLLETPHRGNRRFAATTAHAVRLGLQDGDKPIHVLQDRKYNTVYPRLDDRQLLIFARKGDETPVKTIDLKGATVSLKTGDGREVVEIKRVITGYFSSSVEVLLVFTDPSEDRELSTWVEILASEGRDDAGQPEQHGLTSNRPIRVNEELDIRTLRHLLQSFMTQFRDLVLNHVPKGIKNKMVDKLQENLHHSLLEEIYLNNPEEAFTRYTREAEEVVMKKKELLKKVQTLEAAVNHLRIL